MKEKEQLLPLGTMARKLNVTTKWLRKEAEAKRLPCLKAGDRYLFVYDTVFAILVERARQGEGVSLKI